MKERSPIQIIIFIFLITVLGFGNFSCNQNEGKDEDHFCLIQKPTGGEIWFKGSVSKIMWLDNHSEFVRINLIREGIEVLTLTESIVNSGIFRWEIPENLEENANYSIQIISLNDETIANQSQEDFTIRDPFPASEFVDQRDGQTYKTLKIGDRWWMAENLNFETETGSMSYMDDPVYAETFGRLYLWDAAMIACPDGWEIPSDDNWKELELELGLTEEEIEKTGMRGNDAGCQMKEGGGSGFEALFAGYYHGFMPPYRCGHIHNDTRFWTSTKEKDRETHVWRRFLSIGDDGIDRNITWTTNGNSVRCIQSQ